MTASCCPRAYQRAFSRGKAFTFLGGFCKQRPSEPQFFPLSFAQERLWFLDQLQPGLAVYNLATSVPLAGPLNVAALEQSVQEIVHRHEALRTTFGVVAGQPVQVIAPPGLWPLPLLDLRQMPATTRAAEAQRVAQREAQRPFDLTQGPLLRALLVCLDATAHVLLLTLHHSIADAWSLGVLGHELTVLYDAYAAGQPSPLPALPIQYADYAQWQRQWLRGEELERLLAYWRGQLAGVPAVLDLPSDRPRPAVQTFQGAWQSFRRGGVLAGAVGSARRRAGVTLFMTLLAAWQTLLYRYSGQEDVVVGMPIANRTRAELEGLIGFFANTLVVRTDLRGQPRFVDLLAQVRQVTLGAYAHQDLPFEKLVEDLQPVRHLSHHPLFQVMFAYQNVPTLRTPGPGAGAPAAAPGGCPWCWARRSLTCPCSWRSGERSCGGPSNTTRICSTTTGSGGWWATGRRCWRGLWRRRSGGCGSCRC